MAKDKVSRGRGRPPLEEKLGVQVSTRLPEARYAQLDAIAKAEERSVSFILRKAAEEWLDRYPPREKK